MHYHNFTMADQKWQVRLAVKSDIPALHALIEASIRGLQAGDYTPAQIEGAIGTVLGLDTQLIRDQTYFIVEEATDSNAKLGSNQVSSHAKRSRARSAGCGGWSMRKTLFGSDKAPGREMGREPELLDPVSDPNAAAKIRAIFVHPDYARQGIGSLILAHCESAAMAAGFTRFEMGSTLTGLPLYTLKGYVAGERIEVPLSNGESLPIVKMIKAARPQ